MNKYVCFWKSKQITVEASTSYEAQQKAQKQFGAKKGYEVTVMLAELNGEVYVQSLV